MTADALSDPAAVARARRRRDAWRTRLAATVYASAPYQGYLRRQPAKPLVWTPAAIHAGAADRANAMFQGRYACAGHTVRTQNDAPWRVGEVHPGWLAHFHTCGWLGDFAAVPGPTARRQARELLKRWIADFARWDGVAWRADIMAARLVNWLAFADFVLADAEPSFNETLLRSISVQVRHLSRVSPRGLAPVQRATARAGLLVAYLALGRRGRTFARTLDRLADDATALANGAEAAPSALLDALAALAVLHRSLAACALETPDAVARAMQHLAATLRLVRHGDGRLAIFHGGWEEDADRVRETLAAASAKPPPAESNGYVRLEQGRLVLIAETAAVPARAADGFASALACEVSIGKERLFVNCGTADDEDAGWRRAARLSAAHSTLVIDDRSHGLAGAGAPDRPAQALRGEEGDSVWLELSADVYAAAFGVRLTRRFHMAKDGHELVCEEQVSPHEAAPAAARAPETLTSRLHLHPKVAASPLGDGRQVLLRLGKGSGWVFETSDGAVAVEDSVYLGERGRRRRTRQLVLTRPIADRACRTVWRLVRMDDRS